MKPVSSFRCILEPGRGRRRLTKLLVPGLIAHLDFVDGSPHMHRIDNTGGATDRPVDSECQAGQSANPSVESLSGGNGMAGLLVNPKSRRNRQHLNDLVEVASGCSNMHIRITDQPGEISRGLSELADESVNVLAISGGDGTVSRVLTHLIEEMPFPSVPLIAILPGGTANMIGGDVGLTGSLMSALRRLCEWLEGSAGQAQIRTRPVLRVIPGAGKLATYGMFFGAGAIVQGIEYTNSNIHSRGLKDELSLGVGLLRSMWGIVRQDPRFIQPTSLAFGINGGPVGAPGSMTLVLVSSLERLFLNMHPYWGDDNGKPLHMSMICNPADRLLRALPSLLRGRPNRRLTQDKGYVSYNIESMRLVFDGPFTLDGEILHASTESGPVEVCNGGELSFIRM